MKIDDEELLLALQNFAKKLNHAPTSSEARYDKSFSYATQLYVRRFGSWAEGLCRAGLNPNENREKWRKWEILCRDIAKALYSGPIQSSKVTGIEGLVDLFIPSEKLIVEVMTCPYVSKRKKSQAFRFTRNGYRLEFWCLEQGTELPANECYVYVYKNDLERRLVRKRRSDLIGRLNQLSKESHGFMTREIAIKLLQSKAKELNRSLVSSDFKKSTPDYPQFYTLVRPFNNSFHKALRAAGLQPKISPSRLS